MATASSPLTFDLSLDNVFKKASVIEQPLGYETYGVHSPGFKSINYMETLRSVYSRRNPPVTITLKCTNSKHGTVYTIQKRHREEIHRKSLQCWHQSATIWKLPQAGATVSRQQCTFWRNLLWFDLWPDLNLNRSNATNRRGWFQGPRPPSGPCSEQFWRCSRLMRFAVISVVCLKNTASRQDQAGEGSLRLFM